MAIYDPQIEDEEERKKKLHLLREWRPSTSGGNVPDVGQGQHEKPLVSLTGNTAPPEGTTRNQTHSVAPANQMSRNPWRGYNPRFDDPNYGKKKKEKESRRRDWDTYQRPYGEGPLTQGEADAGDTLRRYGVPKEKVSEMMGDVRSYTGRGEVENADDLWWSGAYLPPDRRTRTGPSIWNFGPDDSAILHEFAHHNSPIAKQGDMFAGPSFMTALNRHAQQPLSYTAKAARDVLSMGQNPEESYAYYAEAIGGNIDELPPELRGFYEGFYGGNPLPGVSQWQDTSPSNAPLDPNTSLRDWYRNEARMRTPDPWLLVNTLRSVIGMGPRR